jgi:hypothetical protein
MTIVTISLTTQQTRENLCPQIAVAASSATSRTARPRTPPSPAPWAATDGSVGALGGTSELRPLRSFTTRARAPRHLALFKFRLDREHCFEHDAALGTYVARRPRPVLMRPTAIAIRHMHRLGRAAARRRARRERGKRQRSSAAARPPSPAQLVELIDPPQEVARIWSKSLAHGGHTVGESQARASVS